MIKSRQLSSLVPSISEILISFTSKEDKLSSKRLSLSLKKILKMKDLSFKLRKQNKLPLSFENFRPIRLEKKKRRIAKTVSASKTNKIKKAPP